MPTRPSTFSALQINRLGRLVPLAESKNMGTPLHCMTELPLGVSLMGSTSNYKHRNGVIITGILYILAYIPWYIQ
jgi:hypothetical protein